MPCTQSAAFLHSAHGAVPDTEYVDPATHGGGASLHTRSFPGSQLEDIPWTHPLAFLHGPHGAAPVPDQVDPATHGVGGDSLHTRLVVASHADAAPCTQSAAFLHNAHGAVPAADQVEPATQFSTTQQASRSAMVFDGEQATSAHRDPPLVSLNAKLAPQSSLVTGLAPHVACGTQHAVLSAGTLVGSHVAPVQDNAELAML